MVNIYNFFLPKILLKMPVIVEKRALINVEMPIKKEAFSKDKENSVFKNEVA